MTSESKIQIARAVVQITVGVCVSAVAGVQINAFRPTELTKLGTVIWGVGSTAINGAITKVGMEYAGQSFDDFIDNDPNQHIMRDIFINRH